MTQRHFFPTFHPLSPVILQLQQWWHLCCFTILGSTSIVIHSVKQCLLRNRPGSDVATPRDFLGKRLQWAFTHANQLHWTVQYHHATLSQPEWFGKVWTGTVTLFCSGFTVCGRQNWIVKFCRHFKQCKERWVKYSYIIQHAVNHHLFSQHLLRLKTPLLFTSCFWGAGGGYNAADKQSPSSS